MKQPELGQHVTALRLSQNLTQEQLAEACGISVRSLQRLETGETAPRGNTLNKLNAYFNIDLGAETHANSDTLLLSVMHLSSIMPFVVVPLLIWVWKRDLDSRIAYQGIDVINFQLSMWIYLMLAGASVIYIIGLIILPFMGIAICLISVMNTIKVIQDKPYHYPLTIRFLKH